MTPYQVGFLVSRVLAIICALFAAVYAGGLVWIFESIESVNRGRSDQQSAISLAIQYTFAALPAAVSFTFAALLWFRARTAARVLVPDIQSSQAEPLTFDRASRLAMRILGLFFIVTRTPDLVNWLLWLVLPDHGRDSLVLERMFSTTEVPYWLGSVVQFIVGLILFIGWDRIKRLPSAWQRWSSLPESNDSGS